ncbi:MAG: glycine--tRNA ligase [Sedimentibacter sp.]|nr:glycine--tRNA ligase [Sedimentibacter sp.]
MLALLIDAYNEETLEDGTDRVVLKLHPALAPFKAAVFPLTKKLNEQATELYHMLQKHFNIDYDDAGSIGKRYRRHDEIGTPYGITFDFDSLEDNAVTIRDRDTMQQERVKIEDLVQFINKKILF